MKNLRASEFKAFWENDLGIKFGAWKWTPQPRETSKPVWVLCYNGYAYGKNECPAIKNYFSKLSECIEYSECITERRFK